MRDGRCPKCGSAAVYESGGLRFRRGTFSSNTIPITNFLHETPLENYVCTECGYRESYVGDAAKLQLIREKWRRVAPR